MKSLYVTIGTVSTILISSNLYLASTVSKIDSSLREVRGQVTELREDIEQLKAIRTASTISLSEKERTCLAKNIFHEAGVESMSGKIAVAQVTYERLKTARWGNDVCLVVHARKQFSWTLLKHKVTEKPKGKLWNESILATDKFLLGYRIPQLSGAKYYHTDYIKKPKWVNDSAKLGKIDRHIFYASSL